MSEAIQREAMEYDVVIVGAGPSGLAAAIRLKQLNADLTAALGSPAIKEQFTAAATEPLAMPAEQFSRRLAAEAVLWRDVVKKSGSKFE